MAQKSVLLRANYNTGDKYEIGIEQIQNMGLQGGINMNLTMNMSVSKVTDQEITSEATIKKVKMDMMQGTMTMTYDSTKSDEELDQGGKMMKAQMAPLLKAKIISVMNRYGKTLSTKIEPANPTLDQFADQASSIVFPEEKVSVGSSWSTEDQNMGMTLKTVYTVSKIENGTVYIDISGNVSGMGEGTISGKTEIDIDTGAQNMLENEVSISAMGAQMKVISKMTMKKI